MTSKRDLQGKVVVVTGATGGLGRVLCERFAARGAALGLLDLEPEPVSQLTAELGGRGVDCIGQVCDVTDDSACRAAVTAVADHFGGIDVLVNNAGITQRSAFVDTEVAVYRRVMEVNFFGSLHCTKAALPHLLQRRGQITVISSVAGIGPLLGRTGYAASKHALHGMFGSLRAELRGTGVGVLLVTPAFIKTNINVNALDGDGQKTRHPQATVGKVLSAEDAAEAIVRAVERDRRSLALSPVATLARIVNSLFPALYEWMMVRSLREELNRER